MTKQAGPPPLGGADQLRRDPRPGGDAKRLMSSDDLSFAPASYSAEAGTVDVVWSTGAAVRRFDYWNDRVYYEELDLAGADTARLQAGGAVLMDHYSSIETLIGSVVPGSVRIEGSQGLATLRFDRSSEEGRAVEAKVAGGHLRHVSIGYRVTEWEKQRGDVDEADRWIAREFEPLEISFVPVPADAGAGTRAVRRDGEPAPTTPTTNRAVTAPTQEGRMADVTKPGADAPEVTPRAAVTREAAGADDSIRAERTRATEIRKRCRSLGLGEDLADTLVEDGVSIEHAALRMTDALAARSPKVPAGPRVDVTRDEGDTVRAGLAEALLARCNLLRDADGKPLPVPDRARQFRGMRMLDFAGECIRLHGGDVRGMTPAEIARAALGSRGVQVRGVTGLHSVTDFPNLLANTANKALGLGYTSARRTFVAWARRRSLPDFKSFRVVNLSGAPQLRTISPVGADAGEVEFGTVGEAAETYQLFRAGRRVAVTFEAIVNDDMDGFSRLPQMFGTAAARLESDTVYAILNSNPNMADGNALFGASHANIFGNGINSGAAGTGMVGIPGLSVGRQALRTQTAPNGDILDLDPRWLVVPAALEGLALQFTSASYVASAPGNFNPFASTLTPIVEPRLTSAIQWYLIADNAQVDTVEYAYLDGMEAPQTTSYTDEDTDGVIVKCTHSFGAKATDWRGMARANGS